ncbi:hypothetical protein [Undibacterium umbellatum]|uniref:Uncharacterized protein n=1 Tax=Undibacterium umbellatum TaxID=2762300 RepID=A0ABR6Z8W4_9BURK|nr:hypothetical protein [Undibacterium umbellatum]MBC3908205.1 hypothetical protein [Undibacterium umbellatum]
MAYQDQAAAVCAANPGLCSKLPVYTFGQVGGMIGSCINQSTISMNMIRAGIMG